MTRHDGRRWRVRGIVRPALALLLGLGVLMAATTAAYARNDLRSHANAYVVTPLVSDVATMAPVVDPNLVNGWGLVAGPTTPWWVSDNGTDSSTLYSGAGVPRSLVVEVVGGPTGIVFNGSATAFMLSNETTSVPARFLWATESGTILGWNPAIASLSPTPSVASTHSVVVADLSAGGAVFKGLAIGSADGKSYLYATDFHNGRVDVFGEDFALQSWNGAFVDRRIPKGYAPFGIQAIGGRLFVTYAKQDAAAHDDVKGRGFGFVDEYTMKGRLVRRVATRGVLNAPWGLAMAPSHGFGRFSGCLLVGNFGDGHIHAYAKNHHGVWTPKGTLRKKNGKPLFIDGLWGIGFGNGSGSGPTTTLYFAAGPNGESHGLFGSVTAR
jgi:uncharacterized protein (TIGR03118 family)